MPQNIIVIAGPTASGKSALALDLAKTYNGVVVNADASQVYEHIPTISAAPSVEDRKIAEHQLYCYLDEAVNGNVCMWLDLAVDCVHKIWQEGKTPIFVGGSGMYIDNLINGVTPIPETPSEIRKQVANEMQKQGLSSIYQKLCKIDDKTSIMLKANDKTRICRAYEIWLSTGKTISFWYQQPMLRKLPEATFFSISLLPEKKILDERCRIRFSKMIENGAIDEVKYLLSRNLSPSLPAMSAKGVPEIISALKGEISITQAAELAVLHTRQYAKRQLTWFRNKLKADVIFKECYEGQKTLINCVKKQYK